MPTATKEKAIRKPTLSALSRELFGLLARVEDLEDLRDLDAAIARNANKPGVAWEKAKSDLARH